MQVNELITSDPDILSGQTVFAGTRVPVETLFDHLEAGILLDEFLDDFPTVSRAQAVVVLDTAKEFVINIDPSLDKYDDIILFPNELAKANEQLKKSNLSELLKLQQ
jgi:uncharacterized protein (DUF433 family)